MVGQHARLPDIVPHHREGAAARLPYGGAQYKVSEICGFCVICSPIVLLLKEASPMYIRTTTYAYNPAQADELLQLNDEHLIPRLGQLPVSSATPTAWTRKLAGASPSPFGRVGKPPMAFGQPWAGWCSSSRRSGWSSIPPRSIKSPVRLKEEQQNKGWDDDRPY